MSEPLRIGLVGAGWVTQYHLSGWAAQSGRARVVAIADPSEQAARTRADAFGIPAIYPSAEAMFANETLDAIDIAAPRERHADLVRLAVAHSLPILCQKPLATNLEEAEALVAELGATRLMVHENWRFRRYYRDAAQWIREGRVGVVQQCMMTLLASGLIPASDGTLPTLQRQPFFATLDRLLVSEVLIHQLDTLRTLLGELTVVDSRLGQVCPDVRGEDNAAITMRAASGAAVTLIGNLAVHGYPPALADELLVVGDRGTLRLSGNVLECIGPVATRQEYDMEACYRDSYRDVIAHFIDALQTGGAFETSPADNLRTLRLVEDSYCQAGKS
ncbi:MAG: Gfo/Idh/MocA family protein [Janthinobacterium lividum]